MPVTPLGEGMACCSVTSGRKELQKDVSTWFCEGNATALRVQVKLFHCFVRGAAPISL